MYYVYLLRSKHSVAKTYIGYTSDLKTRLFKHNQGKVKSTRYYLPWTLESYVAFSEKSQALLFEGYLKSGSGRAFSKKYLFKKTNE